MSSSLIMITSKLLLLSLESPPSVGVASFSKASLKVITEVWTLGEDPVSLSQVCSTEVLLLDGGSLVSEEVSSSS